MLSLKNIVLVRVGRLVGEEKVKVEVEDELDKNFFFEMNYSLILESKGSLHKKWIKSLFFYFRKNLKFDYLHPSDLIWEKLSLHLHLGKTVKSGLPAPLISESPNFELRTF